jgi:ribosomal protein L20
MSKQLKARTKRKRRQLWIERKKAAVRKFKSEAKAR